MGLNYQINNRQVSITAGARTASKQAQPKKNTPKSISGTVKDGNGEPLIGATVRVKGSSTGTVTDIDGNYTLNVPANAELEISYIGFIDQQIHVGNKTNYNIILKENANNLDEVVVIGYGAVKKKDLTGAVAAVKGEELVNKRTTMLSNALQGTLSGVTVSRSSSAPGSGASSIRVRGITTIGESSPLVIVDGVEGSLDYVNANDVESISVLKDAAAASIYGSKAAAGVILVTTKRGNDTGKLDLKYNAEFGWEIPTKQPSMVGVTRYLEMNNELMYNDNPTGGFFQVYTADQTKNWVNYNQSDPNNYPITDWKEMMLKSSAPRMTHTLTVSGGNKAVKSIASLSYDEVDGLYEGRGFQRYMFRSNNDFKINDKLNVALDVNIRHAKSKTKNYDPFNDMRKMPAIYPATWNDGRIASGKSGANPYGLLTDGGKSVSHSTQIAGKGQITFKPIKDLSLSAVISPFINYQKQKAFRLAAWYTLPDDPETIGGYLDAGSLYATNKLTENRNNNWMARLQANFMKNFGANAQHLLTASAGVEATSTEYKGFSITRRGYFREYGGYFDYVPTDYSMYYQQFMASDEGKGKRNRNLTNELAYYGTLGYGFRDTYIFNVHMRAERSNLFGTRANDEFSPIWSVSGRWNMKKDVLRKVDWVTDVALRASWGYQGNMIPGQTSQMIIRQSTLTDYIFQKPYATISNYPNPNLKWEKTSSFNVGLDFALFNNKVRGTVSYFYKHTSDAFLTKKISEINGITQYVVNAGTLDNQGVELSFSFTPIEQANIGGNKRGFVWRIDPQIGEVINKVVNRAINNKTNVLRDELTYNDFLNGNLDVAGKPVGTFYSYKFKGLDHETGAPTFYGCEDEKKEEYMAEYANLTREEVFLKVMEESGCREPYIQGGIANYFGYGNWGLSFNLTYSLGNKIRLSKITSGYATNVAYPQQNLRKEFVNRWRRPGDEAYTNIPGLSTEATTNYSMWWNNYPATAYSFAGTVYDMYDNSDLRVVSGNYLKLQTLSLRYNVDEKLVKALGIKAAYINLVGTNLFTICSSKLKGQDPSQSGSAPALNLSVRPSYSLNVSLTF